MYSSAYPIFDETTPEIIEPNPILQLNSVKNVVFAAPKLNGETAIIAVFCKLD